MVTLSRRRALGALSGLLAALAAPATPAVAQQTTTPAVTETQSYTVTIPEPAAAPAPAVVPSSAPTAPLPRRLAYTGGDPLLIIAGGLAIAALSLLVRRRTRA